MAQRLVAPNSSAPDLAGQVAVVTGAAGTIGKVCAEVLARAGADVGCIDLVSCEETERLVRRQGRRTMGVSGDVTSRTAIREAVNRVAEGLGVPNILVVSSGIGAGRSLTELDEADLEEVLSVNLKGVFWATQAVLPFMERGGYGKIVYLGSRAAVDGGTMAGPHYVASKGGVHALAIWVAKEYARRGICCNSLAPGLVPSPLSDRVSRESGRSVAPESFRLGRPGTPQDMAQAVLFLASPASNYITGQVLQI